MSDGKTKSFNLSVLVTGVAFVFFVLFWVLDASGAPSWVHLAFLVSQTIMISILIWQVCDPFADAAQYIGQQLNIPGSVRGATLDAVASSMPELFSGIFFVVVAITAAEKADLAQASGEGFGATVATCAGSAVYNMILIPAVCALFISFVRKDRPTIDIEDRVISRDGMWFLGAEILLIVFLYANEMHWWMAVVLLVTYLVYVMVLYSDARQFKQKLGELRAKVESGLSPQDAIDQMREAGQKVSRDLADRLEETDEGEDEADSAGVLFGLFEIPLSMPTAWSIIVIAAMLAAGACYWLVRVTESLAHGLEIPLFFVAVIVAAAASSVPDTFLSIASARRGDDDGAVSNAFGSNIFDITICLSVPLLVGCYLNQWRPIRLVNEQGEVMEGLVWLRILLCVLSVLTLLIMWHNRQLTRFKAIVLCLLYAVFVGYAILGSAGHLSSGG